MANIQKYGTYEPEAAAAEAEELAKGTSEFFKPGVGRNPIRVLPPPLGKNSPFVVTYQHALDLPGMSKMLSFNCPRLMAKRPCPVCQEADRLKGTGRQADYDLAGEFFARVRVYTNIIDRTNPENGPVIWAFGKKIHEALTALRQDKDAGGDFTDPTENGFDLIVTRVGTGKNDTKYTVNPARSCSELGDMEWIDMQHDLSRYARVPSADDIRQMLEDNGVLRPNRGGPAPTQAGRGPRRRTAEADAMDVEAEVVK